MDVNEYATFSESIADGAIRMRIRITEAACQIAGKPRITKPDSKGTARLRQWSTGELDAIAFYRIDP